MPMLYRFSFIKPQAEVKLESKLAASDHEQEIDTDQLNKGLTANKYILRSSIDVMSGEESISVLVDDHEDAPEQTRILELLQSSQPYWRVSEIEKEPPESIDLTEYDAHETCGHDHDHDDDHDEHHHSHHHHDKHHAHSEHKHDHNPIHQNHKHHHSHHHHKHHDHAHGEHKHDQDHHEHDEEHHHDDHNTDEHGDGHVHHEHSAPKFLSKGSHKKSARVIKKKPHKHNHWVKGIIGSLFGLGLLALSVLSLNIPAIAFYLISGATALTTIYLGKDTFVQGIKSLVKSKKLSMNMLYTISTVTILAVSLASFFIPGLPLMYEAAPLILGLWHIGEAIEHSLEEKIGRHLDIRDYAPKKATLLHKGIEEECPVNSLIPNDIILVRKGQVIPVNGKCLEDVWLITTIINGSRVPKLFNRGETIIAGMQLLNDRDSKDIKIQVIQTFQKSNLSIIANSIKDAHKEKAPVEEFTAKVLKYFVPGLLATAVISGIIIGCLFSPALAIQCAISVLVSACPCALKLITPLAVKIGMNKAAQHGINFKNGKALQAAASIDTVVLDLNGTLTTGNPQIIEHTIFNKELFENEDVFFQHIALLEQHSERPIAKTILASLSNRNFSPLPPLSINGDVENPNCGIKAKINGVTYIIGNAKMLEINGIPAQAPMVGAIYLVRETEVVGRLIVADPLRHDAKQAVTALQKAGKKVCLCTGSDPHTAEHYAGLLGIPTDKEHLRGGYSLKDKGLFIDELRSKNNKVSMIGDAVNDTSAISKSHCGIAIKSSISSIGDELAQDKAGVIIQNDSLMPIVTAFEIAKQTKRNIWQNLMISLTYNTSATLVAAGLFLALGFALNPVIGIALMVLETTLVLANLYRLKHQSVPSLELTNSPTPSSPPIETTHRRLSNLPRPDKKNDITHSLVHRNGTSPTTTRGLNIFNPPPIRNETWPHDYHDSYVPPLQREENRLAL